MRSRAHLPKIIKLAWVSAVMKVREAADRQRYSSDARQKAQAAQDEAAYVAEMDRLMTRIRAVEAQLLLKGKMKLRRSAVGSSGLSSR